MAEIITVNITCRVTDPQALWTKARDHLVECNNLEPDSEGDDVIGTRDDPDVPNCLIMLLDRSENLAGAEIEGSSYE